MTISLEISAMRETAAEGGREAYRPSTDAAASWARFTASTPSDTGAAGAGWGAAGLNAGLVIVKPNGRFSRFCGRS